MSVELTRARRELARLQRRVEVLKCGRVHKLKTPLGLESQAMVRELSAQIKRKELDVRRLSLTGPWKVIDGLKSITLLRKAIRAAERQNRKAGGG